MKFSFNIFIAIVFAFTCCRLFAQETSGGLTGRISDQKGQPLAGASVLATHIPSGTFYGTISTGEGRYILNNVKIGGPFLIKVSLIGMKMQSKDSITVSLGAPATLNFILADASQALSEVVIKANRNTKANATGAGTNISSSQLKLIPASSRSFQDFTRLTPQYNGNSFAGTNFRYNNVTIDGAINNDAIGFSPSLGGQTGTSGQPGSSTRTNPISIDAIQAIQVYLAPYDVKIGNFTGGSINAVTRSGTNQVEGSVYYFGRNAALTGPDRVSGAGKLPSDFHDLQTGFRFGLPLIKNKLFLFSNEEVGRRVNPLTQTATTAGSAAILSPLFADSLRRFVNRSFNFDPGTPDSYSIYSNSVKFFNRLDWNISAGHQFNIRSNIVSSQATNLERDEQNFRFSSLDYKQINLQNSTVAELRSRFSNTLSNSLVVGYSTVHDFREPSSYEYYPQVQIGGQTLGTFILYGTDREASIFNLKQNTFEITDNVTWFKGRHTFTIGTHNELYGITYGFVNSPNGRIDYDNLDQFFAGQPARVRGNFAYADQSRKYSTENPSAKFKVNLYSGYFQDEFQISEKFRLIPGLRVDLAYLPQKPILSYKTRSALQDLFYGTTYPHTQTRDISNDVFGRAQLSPRLGFNYDLHNDKSVIFRGGTGLFTGRIPFAWLGYAYYNNGNTYGAFDRRYDYTGDPTKIPPVQPVLPNAATDPRRPSPNGIAESAAIEGGAGALSTGGITQVDLINNKFKMPQVWRTSGAVDLNLKSGYRLTFEGLFTKTIYDVQFQQINQQDSAGYYIYDLDKQQPIFNGKPVDPAFTAIYLLSNTNKGYRYSLTAQGTKSFAAGPSLSVAYTYGVSKDVSNGIRNSAESNWQLNQSLNPNNPGLAYSNFDIRHRIVSTINYALGYGRSGRYRSSFSIFFSAASGQPFTYGFVNTNPNIQRTGQQVSLAYIPKISEFYRFFQDGAIALSNGNTETKSARDQGAEFYRWVANNKYLKDRLGQFTERNGAHTPWNINADFKFIQEVALAGRKGRKGGKQVISFTYDIFNLTNLIYKELGKVYFVSNLFNSTASVGLRPAPRAPERGGYPIFIWEEPAAPYQVDLLASRWQMQLGVRYSF